MECRRPDLVDLRIPFGFVAILGVIALFGMITCNSVTLVVQIDEDPRARCAGVERDPIRTARPFGTPACLRRARDLFPFIHASLEIRPNPVPASSTPRERGFKAP